MNNKAKSIGDKYYSDGAGIVTILDVYISPTSQERVYLVKDEEDNTYLFTGRELYDTEQKNWNIKEGSN